ncbi:MAG TPA: hypothetical protein VN722_08435 [Hanamia sp.]|nr:hypothetical protein [Hanamia sp.]
MDSFIFYGDYNKQIQTDNLQQIIGSNQSILDSIQLASVEECVSYLKQKYDVADTFKPTVTWDPTKSYNAGQTVYLNAVAYDATKTYALAALTLQAGNVYSCSTAITIAEAFNAAHWTLLGAQYTIYYAQLPKPKFNYQQIYAVGNQVFWKNNTYTCKIASPILDHAAQLEIGVSVDSVVANIFPDDTTNGVTYWGNGVPYSVAINTQLSNTTFWTLGDNRDQKLVMICVDIILYHLHCRIAPRNIPDLRIMRYMGNHEDRETRGQRVLYPTYCALGWLQAATIGDDITPELSIIQPSSGSRIRFGGNVKLINQY